MSRFGWFIFGVVVTCSVLALGAYLYVNEGGVQMAVDSPQFPFEDALANMALNASFAGSLNLKNPVPLNADDLTAGAQTFKTHCAGCHGLPGKPSSMGKRIFPAAPQLLEPNEMVTDDPVGETYWKVTNGIRLSGMPEFKTALPESQRWQVVMMLKHADKLPRAAQAALSAH
jgi:mono/diheme cytochrome c family protein